MSVCNLIPINIPFTMDHTSLPLRAYEHRASASIMVSLPSIRELGLWGSRRASHDDRSAGVGHSQSSASSSFDTYTQRHFKTESFERSRHCRTGQAFGYFASSSESTRGEYDVTGYAFSDDH